MRAENIVCDAKYVGRTIYLPPQIFHKKAIDASGFLFNQFDEETVYIENTCPVAMDLMPRSCHIPLSSAFTDENIQDTIAAIK